ncbi:hydrocephalus-inducing protein-like [Octopus sinensis]|uniref:Hydrocephalus-inducing protein-like n=1 Tax=Octopus sinensis TaxID=2607531 RepID=A0A6P7T6T6_9MOLL|nr:hydrocephalus-inducing protein-like [Octopus sinensis]
MTTKNLCRWKTEYSMSAVSDNLKYHVNCKKRKMISVIDNDVLCPQYVSKAMAPRNPKLVKEPEEESQLIPSVFLKNISMTTEERLTNTRTMRIPEKLQLLEIGDTVHHKISTVNINEPIFQPFPSEIFFQQYEPFKVYEVSLLLENKDRIPRTVKVNQEASPYFKLIPPPDAHHKVAPGLALVFKVQFTPEENKDYEHEIVCTTERERYVVPIKAIGARAIVDIPDEIHFPTCPVLMASTKTILLRNIGNRDAKFSFFTLLPFSVSPVHGTVAVNANSQVDIEFYPTEVGNHHGQLYLRYDTGEVLFIELHAVAQDINIRLDRNSVRIENTFISLTNQRSVFIHNRTNVVAKYKWTNFPTWIDEIEQKERFVSDIEETRQTEIENFIQDYTGDPSLNDKISVMNRSYLNRRKLIEDGSGLFYDEVFKIEPIEGEIWPNQTMQINIMFKPLEAKSYIKTAYCEITGRENRLPLQLRGEGKGPKVQLSVNIMNVGPIFIGSCHYYEVILANHGQILASYVIQKSFSAFASYFTFNPNNGVVQPGGHQAIRVKFQGSSLGDFDEVFKFQVEGLPQPVELKFRGSVIGPTFHFDVAQLEFGNVSYGFQYMKTFQMHNTSLIPMNFRLHVPGDGIVDSIPSIKGNFYPKRADKQTLPPKEFKIIPSEGVVEAMSSLQVTVQFVSNTVSRYEMALVVDVINVADQVFSMPITARCLVPTVVVANPVLMYHRCFLNYPYTQYVKLQNLSNLRARYDLEPQDPDKWSSISYCSSEPSGILEAFSSFDVPLTIKTGCLRELVAPAYFKVFGSSEYITVEISCYGEGPVVHVAPLEVDWGTITVLKDVERKITLLNESPIPATFEASMSRPNSFFHVSPKDGVILPEEKMILTLTANINDIINFEDKINIKFGDNSERFVILKAFGEGSTIVADPPLSSVLNLGPHFSNKTLKKKIVFTNKGRRQQQVNWVIQTNTLQLPKLSKQEAQLTKLNEKQVSVKTSTSPETKASVFEIIPHRFKLLPGESMGVYLKGFVEKPADINEILHCYSILGKHGGKKLVINVNVKAQFIDPLLDFSRENIFFRTDKTPDMKLGLLYQDLQLTNTAILPLTINLQIPDPFKIVYNDEILSEVKIQIDVGEVCALKIQFNPCYKDDLVTRIIEQSLTISYDEHPHIDYITLHGEVYFPNLTFEQTEVDFGCIMNNSTETKIINIMNNSPLVVRYQWTMFTLELTKKVVNHELIKHLDSTSSIHGTESKSKMSSAGFEDLKAYKEYDSELFTSGDISSTIMNVGNQDLYGGGAYTILNELDEENSGKDNCQAFNLLPMNGVLHPGQAELVKVTFFGHANTTARVTAMCTVEGGPTYCIQLSGEASYLSYKFDVLSIDYGEQKYDQVAEATITLTNTGLVGCNFCTINMVKIEDEIPPQTPIVVPESGHIKSGDSQVLTVKYLPGFPVKFNSSFSIQVNHFKPETITLIGNGIFPHLLLNLPRHKHDSLYKKSLKAAKVHLSKEAASSNVPMEPKAENEKDEVNNVEEQEETFKETELQKEIDRVAVTLYINGPETDSICRSDLEIPSFVLDQKRASSIIYSNTRILRKDSSKLWRQRPFLPIYELDLGFVILGLITNRTVTLTNCGNLSVSFKIVYEHLQYWGFKIDLHKVTNLPPQESASFQLTFDPRGANLTKGPIETKLLISITNGPQIIVSLRAHITMPDMEVSHDILDFENVKCGECKIMSTQLHNHQYVQCEWSYLPSSSKKNQAKNEAQDTANKKAALAMRPRKNFEIIPPSGVLQPGQRVNIQVKFMPTEGKLYEKRIPIRIAQSSERIILQCKGNGIEPVLELLEEHVTYRPILPHSCGDEKEVIVKNPCDFPIEFYSVDFDSNYLEEEKILRLMRGYDDYKTLLLPPRAAGEKLPQELLDFYKARKKRLEEMEKFHKEGMSLLSSVSEDTQEQDVKEDTETEGIEVKKYDSAENLIEVIIPPFTSKCTSPENVTLESVEQTEKLNVDDIEEAKVRDADSSGVGELEMTPVAAAITRYLGIDLSPDGQAARNRRGIAIIIHGSPFSGKSTTATDIAHYYDAALLNIDDVVIDAIAKGATPASLKARELCADAAQRWREEQRTQEESEEKKPGTETNTTTTGGAYPRKASNMNKGLIGANMTSNRGGDTAQQQSVSPPPLVYPPVKELNIKSGIAGEAGLVSCILPEDVLVEILADRLQMPDCHKGVVIDSLESVFSPSFQLLEQVILKAFNNRRYIFHISLRLDFHTYQNRKKELKEQEEKQKILEDELERKWIEEMSEGEYDAMSEEQRARVEGRLMVIKKNRMSREVKEKEERERKEREMQEAENRRLMEIKSRKKGKRPAPPSNEKDKDKKAGPLDKDKKACEKVGTKGVGHKYEGDSKGGVTERPDSQATDRNDMTEERRKRSVRRPGVDASSSKGKEEIPEDPYKELTKEELLEMQKYVLRIST